MSYKEIYFAKERENHNNFIVVTGVSASGKDYLLDKTRDTDEKLQSGLQVVHFGDILFHELEKRHGIKTKDDIKKSLTADQVTSAMDGIYARIGELQPAVINGHVVPRQQDNLITNPKFERLINPLGYIFVWANPEQIKVWRDKDVHLRNRPEETVEEIELHQEIALQVVSVFAKSLGSSMRSINNNMDMTGKNIQSIREELQSLL